MHVSVLVLADTLFGSAAWPCGMAAGPSFQKVEVFSRLNVVLCLDEKGAATYGFQQ